MNTKTKNPPLSAVGDYSVNEAVTFGPYGKGDVACVVRTGPRCQKIEHWKSRKAASVFYRTGASACGGCEGERYLLVSDYLTMGCRDVCDDQDHMTKEMLDICVGQFPDMKDIYAKDYEYAAKNYPPVEF